MRLFAGATLISLSPVWVRLVDIPATASAFYRVAIGAVALAVYLAIRRKPLALPGRVWLILSASAVFFALDLMFWHRSINLIGPGLSTLLANFQVFILTGFGILFLGQKPTRWQLIAVPAAIAGLALIVGFDWNALPSDYRAGVLFGLLTACMYAGYMLTLRASRRDASDALPTREVFVVSAATAVLLAGVMSVENVSFAISRGDLGWMTAYGVLSHCIGWILIASSLPKVTTAQAGLALLLQPTLSFVWDVAIFGRVMLPRELLGAGIALAAIYLGSRKSSQ